MKNIYFPEEEITENDLYFICSMIERTARKIHQKNKYVVNKIGRKDFLHLISVANVEHSENPEDVAERWISDYDLENGSFDVCDIDQNLAVQIPTPLQMGKVYTRLILMTATPGEDYVDGILRVYNDEICETIDNYNASAYYEPSYVVARAYRAGGF